jgi:hypothetical protein
LPLLLSLPELPCSSNSTSPSVPTRAHYWSYFYWITSKLSQISNNSHEFFTHSQTEIGLVASLILLVSNVFSIHLSHSLNTMLSTVCYLRCQMVARLLIWPPPVIGNHVFQILNHPSCQLSYMWPEMATY